MTSGGCGYGSPPSPSHFVSALLSVPFVQRTRLLVDNGGTGKVLNTIGFCKTFEFLQPYCCPLSVSSWAGMPCSAKMLLR